jgi:hypothetical protein
MAKGPYHCKLDNNCQRWITFIALVFCGMAGSLHAATHIQQASNSDVSGKSRTSFSATFTSRTIPGDAILIGVTYGNANPTITASDSQGNAYVQAIKTYDPGHHQGCAILYALGTRGNAPDTVTLKFGSSVAYLALGIHEYSGISALDVASGNRGSGSNLFSGSATTTTSGDLIFGTGVEDGVGHGDTFAPGAGFAKRVDLGSAAAYADEDRVLNAAGSVAVTWNMAPGSNWIANMAAFRTSPSAAATGVAPAISGLSPSSGPAGAIVTITGANFGAAQGSSTVTFNGASATPTGWSATSIVTALPSGASTGHVVVTAGGQLSNGLSFTVTVPVSPPTIMSLSPTSGLAGTAVTITGANFGATQGSSTVTFNGTSATPTGWSATSIVTAVPSGATTGNVVVTAGGQVSNASNFTVGPLTGSSAAPALVQHVSHSNTQGNPVTAYQIRLPNRTQSGNCLVVGVNSSSSGAIPTVTDDVGNTYTRLVSNSDGNQRATLLVALNINAGAQDITVHFGNATSYVAAIASEFYNVATASAADGSVAGSGTGNLISLGSFGPLTPNDLIYQVAVQDSTSDPMISFTQGSGAWSLLSADVMDGMAAQYLVEVAGASVSPTLSMSPSNHWNSAAIALKSGSSGGPIHGIHVVHLQHNALPAYTSSPAYLEFPSSGNLMVVSWIGVAGHDITGITDGHGNSYAQAGSPFGNQDSGDNQIFYAANAMTGTAMTGPILTTTGTDISGSTAELFDIAGAATSPFDSTAGVGMAKGNQSTFGNVAAVQITPSTPNGLIISSLGVANNTVSGLSPGLFLSSVVSPETSPWPNDENNGWGLYYNSDTSPVAFVWNTSGGSVGNWAAIAVAFEAGSPTN